jgi:hypothetical protein
MGRLKKFFGNLKNFNLFVAGLLAVQAILLLVLASADKGVRSVFTSYLTKDELASTAAKSDVLSQGSTRLFDVNVTYLLVGALVTAALFHVAAATFYRRHYEADLKKRTSCLRWAEYSVAGALMAISVGLLSGVAELASLVALAAFVVTTCLLMFGAETINKTAKKTDWLYYRLAGASAMAFGLIMFLYIWGSETYGSGLPSYLYLVYGVIVLVLAFMVDNSISLAKKKGRRADYLYGEKVYACLSFLLKTSVIWTIYAGALRT